jgi:sensor histidine kinase regulating citrate/malate metabolism
MGNTPLRFRVFVATFICSIIPFVLAITVLHTNFLHTVRQQLGQQALDIANLTSSREDVREAYESLTPSLRLQKIGEEIRSHTQVAFVIFIDSNGRQLSHPNESMIGLLFTDGDERLALQGNSYISNRPGASGSSIRAFHPIQYNEDPPLGAVVVGFFEPTTTTILSTINNTLFVVIPFSLLLISMFSALLAGSIKKLLFGMEPLEIATKLTERENMLESVKEGIIAIDQSYKITVINAAAQNLFPLNTEFIGRDISELIPDSMLPAIIYTQKSIPEGQLLINGNIVLTKRQPLIVDGKVRGAIATFRPLTEVHHIAEELTGVTKIVDALRARTHEFLNKLHVISGLIQLESYDEAKKYISNITIKEQSLMSFLINNIQSSVVVGLLMGKASEAQERQIQLEINRMSHLTKLPSYFDEHAMVVVLGNLIENAFDAVQDAQTRNVNVLIEQGYAGISLIVTDSGSGILPSDSPHIFKAGYTTKAKGMGFGLANLKNRVDSANGTITLKTNTHPTDSGTAFHIFIPNRDPFPSEIAVSSL